ncbi:MAG TPA: DM13 domain-containing protein [Agromyces sp.]
MSRLRAAGRVAAVAIPLTLVLSGCHVATDPVPSPVASPTSSPTASEPVDPEPVDPESVAPAPVASAAPALSEFEQQLPLSGRFVSQAAETSGTVRIERRADGTVWVVLEDFRTEDAPDLRVYLKTDPLLQDADGHWVSSENGYDIATVDPARPTQEIEVPGAWDMPAIRSLTVRNYVAPDSPAFGSAALG